MKFLDEYQRGDGLSLSELMDSRKNGGLTYNDFLMLPGHIDFPVSMVSSTHTHTHSTAHCHTLSRMATHPISQCSGRTLFLITDNITLR